MVCCSPKELPTIFEFGGNEARVCFSHETTTKEIDLIADSLSRYGLNLNYAGSTFFEDGKLQNLQLEVTLPNGRTGITRADAVSLQFSYYGFILNEQGYFRIGKIEDNDQ